MKVGDAAEHLLTLIDGADGVIVVVVRKRGDTISAETATSSKFYMSPALVKQLMAKLVTDGHVVKETSHFKPRSS